MTDSRSQADDMTRGTLLVVDGHSLAFRAFFALPVDNFSTSDGRATNAVWGFATMLAQVIDTEKPDHIAVAFDVKGGTFRSELLPAYKGTREAAPEDLLTQLPLIQRMLTALGVTYIEKPGYEGDDVIGTLASMGDAAGYRTLVLSGDRDAFQLVSDTVTVLYPGHHFKDLRHMTPDAVEEKYHVTPAQYPDLAALRGETSDNIPGVPGVGDGFAAKWINQYGGLDGIVEHAGEIGGKKGEALRANLDQVLLNRRVNALVRDLDLGVTPDDLTFGGVDAAAAGELFRSLEFGPRTLSKVLRTFNGGEKPAATARKTSADGPRRDDVLVVPDAETTTDAASVSGWAERWIAPVTAPDTWTLLAQGDANPGEDSIERIVLAAAGRALVIPAPAPRDVTAALTGIIDRHHGTMAVHGYKEHRHLLAACSDDGEGIDLSYPAIDTKLAGYLVHPDFHADTLEQAAAHFLDLHVDEDDTAAVQGMLDLGDEPAETADPEPDRRLLTHAAIVERLARTLAPMLAERGQDDLMRRIELPVSRVLHGMEQVGAKVDMVRLTDMKERFAADVRHAQEEAWRHAGEEVNLKSPKQLQKVLFETLALKPTKRTKSGTYTTNAAALQDLYVRYASDERASGFLGALLRHREIIKLEQIVQTLIDATNPRDGRIHTTFEQTVAATGRLSSVDPNLQNIPNRNAMGREIRSAFVPGDGYTSLLSCDYSQVELRIMADRSGDEALIEAFRSGTDFHRYVASLVYGVPVERIDADQRSHVKAMSYGLAYGLSTYGLAQQLKISPSHAEELKAKYFAVFGKVHDYLESLVADARELGYTQTMFGRRRYFPGLNSTNRTVRETAERGALNAPIQGSAADIMKIAMIDADRALRDAGLRSRIILQIHDELVVEVAPGEEETASRLVADAMEHAVDLSVPLDVSTGLGSDWQLAAH